MAKLSEARKALAYRLTEPVARFLAKTPIGPSIITWSGFSLSVGGAALIATEHFLAAGFIVLIAGFFDMLDGTLARRTNRVTPFGAALDSTFDRLSEAALLVGILVIYAREQSLTGIILVGVALTGSLLVSYVRARAEALGLECQVGLFTRPERVIVRALGLLLNQIDNALIIALAIIAVFSFFTVGHRLVHTWKQTRTK